MAIAVGTGVGVCWIEVTAATGGGPPADGVWQQLNGEIWSGATAYIWGTD